MNRAKLFKVLRIAWSVVWGVACVLLCVLWVRSYSHDDLLFIRHDSTKSTWLGVVQTSETTSVLHSEIGVVQLCWEGLPNAGDYLEVQSRPIEMTEDVATGLPGVEYDNTWYGKMFAIRHCTLVALLIFATFAPWALYVPRRFSLRTLLIATTLVAIGFGTIVWLSR